MAKQDGRYKLLLGREVNEGRRGLGTGSSGGEGDGAVLRGNREVLPGSIGRERRDALRGR